MKTLSYLIPIVLLLLSSCSKSTFEVADNSQYVNPFIGTGGHGHTYPGATLPFGMVQLSPDTRLTGWDGCSGYHYSDSIIYGFSHTHLSGTGVSDYGDLLIMPFCGEEKLQSGYINETTKTDHGYGSVFHKTSEKASPGYYEVLLEKHQIKARLTATERTGYHEYIYPNEQKKKLIIDLTHRDSTIKTMLKQTAYNEIVGHRISHAWAKEQHFYFVIQFSDSINHLQLFKENEKLKGTQSSENKLKSIISFNNSTTSLQIKVGVSFVDTEGARMNLEKENPNWEFDSIKNKARDKWNRELSKILIEDEDIDKKTIFYSALYHTMVVPNIFSDVDGRYRGTDLKIHKNPGHDYYSVFSLWDTYRATHPLYTIIDRERTKDFINTMLLQYQHGGKLPMWELAGNYTGCMIGYHAVPVIADAMVNGITDFDTQLALEAMMSTATADELGKTEFTKYGYIPAHLEVESVSKTLEYSYNDWCIAQTAKLLKQKDTYQEFMQRSQNYQNIFNPHTQFMQAKTDGVFQYPFNPEEVNHNYTEANSWQYSFYVPHNIPHLIELHGGKKQLSLMLDSLFSVSSATSGKHQVDITGLIGQYAHGNEPSHHMAYLYNYCNEPYKTQQYAAQIMNQLYSNTPDGLSGNEDCGQMSAWYVLSALGFYPVCPASGYYDIGTPIFEKATIQLENGNKFTISTSKPNKDATYIKTLELNGKEYSNAYLKHDDLLNGGTLNFTLQDEPCKKLNLQLPSNNQNNPVAAVPFFSTTENTFSDSLLIELGSVQNNVDLKYSFDSLDFKLYTKPFYIKSSSTIWSYAENKEGRSKIAKSNFYKINCNRSIQIKHKYASEYTANGDITLIDGITGNKDFRLGAWQGYDGVNLEATISFTNKENVNKVTLRCLQDNRSWIFMPEKVILYYSSNGTDFVKFKELKPVTKEEDETVIIEEFSFTPLATCKKIKVIAVNEKQIPTWHKGAGNPRWIFFDEIVIE